MTGKTHSNHQSQTTASDPNEATTEFWEWLEKKSQCEHNPANGPDWFDVFPKQVEGFERKETVYEHFPDRITYGRNVPGEAKKADLVRITYDDGVFIGRKQTEVDGHLKWRKNSESVIFRYEEASVAADALRQYLQPQDYNPHPHQLWPPEDLFTEDTG